MAWDIGSKQNNLFRQSRWQLTIWYTGVMAIVMGISAVAVYEAIAHAHRVTANRELRSVAEAIHNTVEDTLMTGGQLNDISANVLPNLCMLGNRCLESFIHAGHSSVDHSSSTSPEKAIAHSHHSDALTSGRYYNGGYYIWVLAPTGKILATAGSNPPGLTDTLPRSSPITEPLSALKVLQDSNGNEYHQVAFPIYTSDSNLNPKLPQATLIVGRSFSDFSAYLANTRRMILLSIPSTMGLIALASWWLAGRAMHPIRLSYTKIQQFTADAAHELRTPLAAVQATTESVNRLPHISDADARDMTQVLTRQHQRLIKLVNDLLLLSRLDARTLPSMTSCCLQDILSDIDEELAALALAKNIRLMLNQPDQPLIYILGNEEQLYRLVINIVSNALQHTPKDGTVTMGLKHHEKTALITVQDTGIGIAERDLPRIFDRFYRADKDRSRQHGGSGLGLSIAMAIAHAHHGDITVESEVGVGSIFTIKLPAE